MTNLAYSIVEEIIRTGGAHEAVVASGARNIDLVRALLAVKGLEIYHHFDERSAAFFALGRARCAERPVILCVTSGTAVSELLPAVIEAYYTRVPLILVTADRPARYRGTGAPQSIEQVGIFSHYTGRSFDLADAEPDFSLEFWDRRSPVHVNVCLEEPKNDTGEAQISVNHDRRTAPAESDESIRTKQGIVRSFLTSVGAPAIILGELAPRWRTVVKDFCLRLQAPIYAEPLSGLREDPELSSLVLRSGDRIMRGDRFDAVIRIGGVPTLRFWRDLELPGAPKILSLGDSQFSGLTQGGHQQADLDRLLSGLDVAPISNKQILALDRLKSSSLEALLGAYPKSEVGLIRELSNSIAGCSLVYLGNSLPIREWDLGAGRDERGLSFSANRGANGIDGQVSSFIGTIPTDGEGWGIFGDLTALYDTSALFVLPQRPSIKSRTVIINNGGGKIFSRVASTRRMMEQETARTVIENPHNVSFQPWADLWEIPYRRYAGPSDLEDLPAHIVLEVRPDASESDAFWNEYDRIWEAA